MLNLAIFLRDNALKRPDKVAIRMGNESFTYRQLETMSTRVAGYLAARINPGDKVAISCPNLPYFPIVYYGILKAGAVVVPLNILMKPEEIAYHLQDSEAKAYFAFEGNDQLAIGQFAFQAFQKSPKCKHMIMITADPKSPGGIGEIPTLEQVLAKTTASFEMLLCRENDTAVILYTSGTTGKPKGAELSHSNIFTNAVICKSLLEGEISFCSQHVSLLVLPLFHSFGQTLGLNAMFFAGAQITMLPRFKAKLVLETMIKHEVSVFAGVPTMYWALLNEAKKLPTAQIDAIKKRLEICVSGGAAMPVEIMQQFEKVFGVSIMEGYGLSETSPVASFNHRNRPHKAGSIGEPIWGVEMRVVDTQNQPLPTGEVGEVVIRGHNIMKGYYRRPEDTQKAIVNGWFHSGDMGKTDEDGYFFIVDRKKDMILRGGENVYPRELEEVLITHPDISMVAVIGIPNKEMGEEIKACVVLKPGAQATSQQLIDWCKEKMAAYKYPRIIEIRDEFPLGPTGKILKRVLKEESL